ncbi:MAG: alpha/beta hydrolase, partial [Oscillospiraceae bacterium]|nr:alpha/beta hydrolase [Oscillospiraceae bacterium]
MIITRQIMIPQLTGKEKRRAYVYVPDESRTNPEARYPVLYMFDGQNVFFDSHATYGKSWGMLDFLQENNVPLIVAAVECNHHPDNGRLSEYSPFSFSDDRFGTVKGRGRKTMDWFVKVFKPLIDRNFPTMPEREYTFIAGSSMGGLMTIYALTKYNHVFSRGAALSP